MIKEDLIFDIGMHQGEDTDFYLKKGFRVVGFEANPSLIEFCKNRFKKEISQGRLVVVEGVIGPDELGDNVNFYQSSLSVWGTVSHDWNIRNKNLGASSKTIVVKRINLKEYFLLFGTPYYAKIDIEGMDRYVLEILRDLEIKPNYISIESNKLSLSELDGEFDILAACGYESFKIVQQKTIPGTGARFLDRTGYPFHFKFPAHSSGAFGEDIKQNWQSLSDAVLEYKKIFRKYNRSGDFAHIEPTGSRKPMVLEHPGWYDTHAKLRDLQNESHPVASVIITCKNRLAHLRQSLLTLSDQKSIELIVVDYGCSEGTRDWVRNHFPGVKVVCVDDDPIFSLSRARNIGALHARGEYLMFSDVDVIIDFPIAKWISDNCIAGEFYSVDPRGDASLCGTAIINKNDFHSAGEYDEAFRGWGGEDTELYQRLRNRLIEHKSISSQGFSTISHGDNLRQLSTEQGGAGSKKMALIICILYSRIISDFFRTFKITLSIEERETMMARVKKFALDLELSKTSSKFNVTVNLGNRAELSTMTLTYQVNW